MAGYVTTNLRLPEDLHKLLKHMAVEEKKSVSQLVREALESLIARQEEKKPRPAEDPFASLIGSCRSGLRDASAKHDEYLYGRSKR